MTKQITCFCTSRKKYSLRDITQGTNCKCFTKGRRHKGISTVAIHKVKSLGRIIN